MVIAGDGREEKVVTSCMDGMIRIWNWIVCVNEGYS